MKGFANLAETSHDRRPLERRRELLNETFANAKVDDFSNLYSEDGVLNEELRLAESYALSGIVIERLWSQLKDLRLAESTSEKLQWNADFWKNFADAHMLLEQPLKAGLLETCREVARKPVEERSSDDNLLIRYFCLQTLTMGDTKQFGVPSFIDFISIYTRLAKVVNELGIGKMGRQLTLEEFSQILSNPSFQEIMEQMMMNNRQVLIPVFGVLEGNTSPNTDDTSRSFKNGFFELTNNESELKLVPKPELIEVLRIAYKDLLSKWTESGSAQPVLRCPVIYLGIMKEMCKWLHDEMMVHYPNSD